MLIFKSLIATFSGTNMPREVAVYRIQDSLFPDTLFPDTLLTAHCL